jgi:hypothetical protein
VSPGTELVEVVVLDVLGWTTVVVLFAEGADDPPQPATVATATKAIATG